MAEKYWVRIGYCAIAVMIFISTLITIRWTIDFVTWSQIDSGWAQVIGSIAAIFGAFFLGERQSRDAMQMVLKTDRIAAYRRGKSILALTDAAQSHTSGALEAFNDEGFDYLGLMFYYSEQTMKNIIEALAAIPAHEIGSYQAVSAVLRIRDSSAYFQKHALRCVAQCRRARNPITGAISSYQKFDTAAIYLCANEIVKNNEILHHEIESMKHEWTDF